MDTRKQNPLSERQNVEPLNLLNLMIRFKNAFLQMWPVLVALSVLLGGWNWYQGKKDFVPMYKTKAIFTVEAGYTPEDIFGTGAYYDQYAARELAAEFPNVMSTDMMRDLVIQELERGYINGYAQAAAVTDSNMLVLTVTGNNPKDIYDYIRAIIKCYPRVASYMVQYPQVKIVTNPTLPTKPYNTFNSVDALAKGATWGAAISLIFFMVCAALSKTIQTTDELKRAVNLPLLIALPRVEQKKRRSGTSGLLTADSDPNMTESMRGLRMKIKKVLRDSDRKIILVTSTLPGEGKTTIAVNVAAALARDSHRVLLVDADLHSQSVARAFDHDTNHDGLMECLKNELAFVRQCIRHNEELKLDYISGRSTDKRHYTLNLNKVNALFDELSKYYDYIVIDTPPNDVVSDAMALCRCASCILYVVRQDYAQRNQIINSVVSMYSKGITISGCIFNGVPKFQRQYGYGYRYGYGYGYDYGSKKYHYGDKYSYGGKYRYGYNGYHGSYSAYLPSKKNRRKKAKSE